MDLEYCQGGARSGVSGAREQWEAWFLELVAPLFNNPTAWGETDSKLFSSSVASLEAFSRTLCGIAPWCECEGHFGRAPTTQVIESIEAFFLNKTNINKVFGDDLSAQPLVEAALISQALLRAPNSIGKHLKGRARDNLIFALRRSRRVKPCFNNWILFSAMVECGLRALGCEDWDCVRIDYALRQFDQWYAGDGHYSDGPNFVFDYYNSYTIHPILVDIVRCFTGERLIEGNERKIIERATRMAGHLEAMISPEGTFPLIGRSLAYRFGILHGLAQAALHDNLPSELPSAAVRCAMSAVMSRFFTADGFFDDKGLLTIGFIGSQSEVGESYVSQGSAYFCAMAFLPLGLPKEHPFWSEPDAPWSTKSAWNGVFPKKKGISEVNSQLAAPKALSPAFVV